MGRCLAAVVLALAIGACQKKGGGSTTPASGDEGGGGGGAKSDKPAAGGGGDDKPGAGGAGGGESGAMGPAEFCQTFGEKAKKEGGKAADFWERNYGKDCVKKLTAEKKKKGDDKWNDFASCAQAQATAADAFDECEL